MIGFLSKVYKIPIIEYSDRKGECLIITAGSGMLMAMMDLIPDAKYAIELKDIENQENFNWFIHEATACLDVICISAWLSISKPEKIQQIINAFNAGKIKNNSSIYLVIYGNVRILSGVKALSLNHLKQLIYENITPYTKEKILSTN